MTLIARPTTYKGIRMRSRLEARFASLLDATGVSWAYEPQAYRATAGEYLPDFQIGPRTFVEVKPHIPDSPTAALESIRKAINVLTEAVPNAWLWIVYSDGVGGAIGPLGHLADDYQVNGHGYFCDRCRRVMFRISYAPEPICPCGGNLSDVADWLSSTGPNPA